MAKTKARSKPSVGWKPPQHIVPHVTLYDPHSGTYDKWTDYKRYRHTHHFAHVFGGYNAAERARNGARWMSSVHPEILLANRDGTGGDYVITPIPADPSWFVPLFGNWDGVRDGILSVLASGGSASVEDIAAALQADPKIIAREARKFADAGMLAKTPSGYMLEKRAPWGDALVNLATARQGHFSASVQTKAEKPLKPFDFAKDALRKVIKDSAAATIALIWSNVQPHQALQPLSVAAKVSSATMRSAIEEMVRGGLIANWPNGKSNTYAPVTFLDYAPQVRAFCIAVGKALGVEPVPEDAYSDDFRWHIPSKRLSGHLNRVQIRDDEAAGFLRYPPNEYTALVFTDEAKAGETDAGDIRTFDGQMIHAGADIGPVEYNGGFYGLQRTVEFETNNASYRGKAYDYGTDGQGHVVYYVHLKRTA